MSLYKRGSVWWSRIVRNGEALCRSTKQRSRSEAIKIESQWIAEIDNSGAAISAFRKEKPLTLKQLAERFEKFAESGGVATARTKDFYKQALKPILDSDLGNTPISALNTEKINAWVIKRGSEIVPPRTKPVGPSRINASLRALRRALKLAEQWGLLRRCPRVTLLPGEHIRDFVLSEADVTHLLSNDKVSPLMRSLIYFLLDTGLRLSEALALTWEHVGFDAKPGASLGWVFVEHGKSKFARRHVPLTQRARGILEDLKKKKTLFVFSTNKRKTKPMSRHWASEQFRALRMGTRLPEDCVIHSLRHTYLTRLGEAGAEAFAIQRLAGHSSVVISQRYVHPTPELLEHAVVKMELAFAAPKGENKEITPALVARVVAELKKGKK